MGALKWTYESCFEEAKKYTSSTDFKKHNSGAYSIAAKKGWIKSYTWFKRPTVHNKKWTHEMCRQEASKYKSRGDFKANNPVAYSVARKNGWLDSYTWFEAKRLPNGYWTRERCYNAAKKYCSRNEFNVKKGVAYQVAWKNGWLDDYEWFSDSLTGKKWTHETCFEEAKKYRVRADFQKYSETAFQVAWRNGWLKEYTWLEMGVISDKNNYVVYCYKDEETNSVYVGLTNSLKRRHKQHYNGILKHGEVQYDTVYRFFHSLGKAIPEPVVLKEGLYAKEAQDFEGYYIELYKSEGFKVLNLAKAGSLGAYGKWDREKCFLEAMKYKSRGEFCDKSSGAYSVARENGWLDDYTWFEVLKGKWTRDTCFDVAMECKSRGELQKKNQVVYDVARENGWLDDYTWFEERRKAHGYWNYERCFSEAQKYHSKTELKKNCPSAYNVSCSNGWLKKYTWFINPHVRWTYEACFEEAKRYKSCSEFSRCNKSAYNAACENGWIGDYTWFEKRFLWTKERCYEEAKKYKTKGEFRKHCPKAYYAVWSKGWLDLFYSADGILK